MASVSTDDRNVLFGLIALRAEVVTPRDLAEAMEGWLHDPDVGLADRLIRQGALREDRRAWVDAMVEVELETPERRALTVTEPPSMEATLTALAAESDPDATMPLPVPTAETVGSSPEPVTTIRSDRRTNSTVIVAPSRFRVLRSHARGGLGEVFLARDEELGRDVALKEIQQRLAHDDRSRARFLLEAEVTGGLEHPGVVPVYSLGRYPDGRPYYAMRFIKGQSLADAIEEYHHAASLHPESRTFLLRNLLRRFLDVCNAIEYAHSRGVLHRDLKPGNIMLGKYGETLVVDWGLAKAVGIAEPAGSPQDEGPLQPASGSGTAETMPGSAIGTPQFMSPEQAAGDVAKIGPASDVYSLGATLYCILTCHAPFEEPDVRLVLHNVQRGVFPPPRSHVGSVPRRLQAICLKAMANRPEDRYPTAHALSQDIAHWMADEPVSAYRENLIGKLTRWGRRHRIWVQAGAAALAAVAIVATFAAVQINRARGLEIRERTRVERMTDELWLGRAIDHFDRGRPGHGMIRLAAGLVKAEEREETPAESTHAYKANLAVWPTHMHPLRQIIPAPDMVLAVALSSDPGVALMGGILPKKGTDGGFARRINPTTGETLGDAVATPREVTALAFLPHDPTRFVVASADGEVTLWKAGSPKPLRSFPHPEPVRALLVDDGKTLITGCDDGLVRSWRLADGREAAPPLPHPGPVHALASLPGSDDLTVTGCADGEIRVWNRAKRAVQGPRMRLTSAVVGLGVVAKERTVIAGGRSGTIHSFSLDDGTAQGMSVTLSTEISCLGVSPDGATVAVGCEDNLTRLYDRRDGRPHGLPLEHLGTVRSLAFSPFGPMLMTGCQDDTARVWGIHPRHRSQQASEILPRIAFGGTADSPGPIRSLQFGVDSPRLLIAASHHAGLVQSPGGEAGVTPISVAEPLSQAALSPDGRLIATVGGPYLRLWPVATSGGRREPTTIALGPGVSGLSVAFEGKGRFLAVGSVERGARVYDLSRAGVPAATPRTDWLDHEGEVRTVNFSHDGNWLLVAGGEIVNVWDAETGTPVGTPINQSGPVYDAVFSNDDSLILTGGENNTARFWNFHEGTTEGPPMVSMGSVVSVAINSDGRTILTGSTDQTVRLWDAATYLPIGPPYRLSSKATRVAFSPADRFIAASGENGEVRVWSLVPPRTESPENLLLWAQSMTGLTLDSTGDGVGIVRGLSAADYRRIRDELKHVKPPILEFEAP